MGIHRVTVTRAREWGDGHSCVKYPTAVMFTFVTSPLLL